MKLLSMTAWFGRLDGDTITFHDGLNLLYAPNESGKTTWAAFLRTMLYGLDTRTRDTKNGPADKNRYRPWSGHPMEGEILLEHHGATLKLRRWTGSGSPMGCFSIINTATGAPVSGCTASNCGEYLLGISREVFTRTAFISQDTVAVSQNRELERRILSLLSSGDEEVSWTETDKTLHSWENSLTGTRGTVPRLTAERDRCSSLLHKTEDARRRIFDARQALQQKELAKAHWSDMLRQGKAQQQRVRSQRFRKAVEALESAQAEEARQRRGLPESLPTAAALQEGLEDYNDLRTLHVSYKRTQTQAEKTQAELDEKLAELEENPFFGLSQEDAEDALRDRTTAGAGGPSALGSVLVALFAPMIFFFLLAIPAVPTKLPVFLYLLFALPLLAMAAIRTHNLSDLDINVADQPLYNADGTEQQLQEYQDLQAEVEALKAVAASQESDLEEQKAEFIRKRREFLAWVRTFSPETDKIRDAGSLINSYIAQLNRLEEARHRTLTAQEVVSTLIAAGCRDDEPTIEDENAPIWTEAELSSAAASLRQAESDIELLNRRLSLAEGELSSYGDSWAAEDKLNHANERLAELNRRSDALKTAREVLAEAGQSIQSRFSPRLNALAGEYACRLTDGKYRKVSLDQHFGVEAEEAEQVAPRDVALLSSGTADQIYLAIRLALCQLVLDDGSSCPLVLDDALLRLDDERLTLALRELKNQTRQILLFTCTGREQQILQKLDSGVQ